MINLLPYNEKKLIERIVTMRFITTTLMILIILAVVAGLLFLPTLITINSRYLLAQKQIAVLEKEGVITNTVNIIELETRTNALQGAFAQPLPPSPIAYVDIVKGAAIPGVSLTGYSISSDAEKTLSIQGVASSREVLQQFANALQKDTRIDSIDNPIANYLKSKDNQFSVSIVFK